MSCGTSSHCIVSCAWFKKHWLAFWEKVDVFLVCLASKYKYYSAYQSPEIYKAKPTLFMSIFKTAKLTKVYFAAFIIGTESKMKLWDVLATCFLLLTSVATRPLYQNTQQAKRTRFPSSYRDSGSLSVEDEESLFQREEHNLQEISMEDQCKTSDQIYQCKMYSSNSSLWVGPVTYVQFPALDKSIKHKGEKLIFPLLLNKFVLTL